jgi:hypothetical protein
LSPFVTGAVATVDLLIRVLWCIAHSIGGFYLVRLWQMERRRFYAFFALEWLFTAARSLLVIAFGKTEHPMIYLAGAILSPAGSVCGLYAFSTLHRYTMNRISTIRGDAKGNYVVRTFADPEDTIPTVRPPPL